MSSCCAILFLSHLYERFESTSRWNGIRLGGSVNSFPSAVVAAGVSAVGHELRSSGIGAVAVVENYCNVDIDVEYRLD
jgi:hypothetical protein